MRRGYTLTELAAVLAIVGILAGIATPRLLSMRDRIAVADAAHHVVVAHQRARITAVLRNCATVLTITADSITLRAKRDTTLLWRDEGPRASGVVLATPAHQITFSPVGLAIGVGNFTYTLTRHDASRSIVVSRLGRVRTT